MGEIPPPPLFGMGTTTHLADKLCTFVEENVATGLRVCGLGIGRGTYVQRRIQPRSRRTQTLCISTAPQKGGRGSEKLEEAKISSHFLPSLLRFLTPFFASLLLPPPPFSPSRMSEGALEVKNVLCNFSQQQRRRRRRRLQPTFSFFFHFLPPPPSRHLSKLIAPNGRERARGRGRGEERKRRLSTPTTTTAAGRRREGGEEAADGR